MAHEWFEDETIARTMNDGFVGIKVDREDRPDIDVVYQKVVQLMGQGGGWPLTVFLTPAGEPFHGGTNAALREVGKRLVDRVDTTWGGFGREPKFLNPTDKRVAKGCRVERRPHDHRDASVRLEIGSRARSMHLMMQRSSSPTTDRGPDPTRQTDIHPNFAPPSVASTWPK